MKKKFLLGLTILSFTLSSTIAPTRSHAMIAMGGTTLGVSWALAAGGCAAVAGGMSYLHDKAKSDGVKGLAIALGVLFGIGAFLLLDSDGNGTLHYQALDSVAGGKLGLTDAQRQSFNNHLEELQVMQEDIHLKVQTRFASDKKVTLERIKIYSQQLWQEYRTDLDADTFVAHQKVSENLANQLRQTFQKTR